MDKTDSIKNEFRAVFTKGTVRTLKNTNDIIQETYNKNGIDRIARSTDLNLFGINFKRENQKDNGKTINLIRIL